MKKERKNSIKTDIKELIDKLNNENIISSQSSSFSSEEEKNNVTVNNKDNIIHEKNIESEQKNIVKDDKIKNVKDDKIKKGRKPKVILPEHNCYTKYTSEELEYYKEKSNRLKVADLIEICKNNEISYKDQSGKTLKKSILVDNLISKNIKII